MNKTIVETVYDERMVTCHIPIPNGSRYPQLKTVKVPQRGKPLGIMVAAQTSKGIRIGWSVFNHNDRRFSREIGLKIAQARVEGKTLFDLPETRSISPKHVKIDLKVNPPDFMLKALDGFARRAMRYFKQNSDHRRIAQIQSTYFCVELEKSRTKKMKKNRGVKAV